MIDDSQYEMGNEQEAPELVMVLQSPYEEQKAKVKRLLPGGNYLLEYIVIAIGYLCKSRNNSVTITSTDMTM